MEKKPRSLSGIKPTGTGSPHLGNVFGMIRPAIALQEDYEPFYFIADYHALTQMKDPDALRKSTRQIAAYFLALGLDPAKAALFKQSDVPETTELSWILGCVLNMGLLFRAHSYKAAVDRGEEGIINHGVFAYPVLMAADILMYQSDVVPVGKDQKQHLEITIEAAKKFNEAFGGDYFKRPKALISETMAVVPGTDGRKMSKSYGNVIEPLADMKTLKAQVMSIQTDSTPMSDPMDTSTCNVFALHALLSSESELEDLKQKYTRSDFGYGHSKLLLLDKLEAGFKSAREEYVRLLDDPEYLDAVLSQGAMKARESAEETMKVVRKAIGLF